jgi:hypothetical protein
MAPKLGFNSCYCFVSETIITSSIFAVIVLVTHYLKALNYFAILNDEMPFFLTINFTLGIDLHIFQVPCIFCQRAPLDQTLTLL